MKDKKEDNNKKNEELIVLEKPQTSFTGDNNFGCAFCNPIVDIK